MFSDSQVTSYRDVYGIDALETGYMHQRRLALHAMYLKLLDPNRLGLRDTGFWSEPNHSSSCGRMGAGQSRGRGPPNENLFS